ncbi:MAG TPA: hypothetical protein VEF04_00720, partial [Blastocatellia bacterium]|nr:hypothetical protein [Blastocatellia bacterium]
VKEAIDELQKLKANPGDVAMTTIDLNLAEAYEAIGDKQKASDIYFDLASQFQGKQSSIGTRALTRLAILDPTRVDNLPDPSKSGSSPAQAPEVIRN